MKADLLAGRHENYLHAPDGAVNTDPGIAYFGEYCERYIALRTSRGKPIRENTKAHYRRLLQNQLASLHKVAIDAESFNPSAIVKWHSAALASAKYTTVAKAYKLLKATLQCAVESGLLPSNPCQIKGAQLGSSNKYVKFEPTEALILNLVDAITPRYRLMTLLTAGLGLRFSEVTALRFGDIRIESGGENTGEKINIAIKRSVAQVGNEFIVGETKSAAGNRILPVPSSLIGELEQFLHSQEWANDKLLFPAASGEFLRYDVYSTAWHRALKKLNIEADGFTPHSLRRFAATKYAIGGAHLTEIQSFLGDSSLEAASRYLLAGARQQQFADTIFADSFLPVAKPPAENG
jgi:integrase